MTLIQARGNIFNSDIRALAHGCNCAGAMGRGIAVEFKRRWPTMYETYHRMCKNGEFGLGDVFHWSQADQHVFNLGTQSHWRTKATLPAIETSVMKMLRLAETQTIARIAMPMIGAGLGGLAADEVLDCLRACARTWTGEIWVCVDFVEEEQLEMIE